LLEENPIKVMLEWLLTELMRVEVEAEAPKGKHSKERKTNYSGYRVRRLNSWVGSEGSQGWLYTVFCDGEEAV